MNSIVQYVIKPVSAVIICVLILHCAGQPRKNAGKQRRCEFQEVWAYLMKGEEAKITGCEPLTDLLYFGVSVNKNGRITGSTTPPELHFTGRKPRIHLVVFKLSNPSLLHVCLDKNKPAREALLGDIAAAAERFEGIQIDFESLNPDDSPAYLDFMTDLKQRIPDKTLSAAVPVRLNGNGRAPYDYTAIADIVDKVFIMAYDQHWETSQAGPISSLSWCDVAADYAVTSIPRDKLVMGIPLYGRAWQGRKINRAVTYHQAVDLEKNSLRKPGRSSDRGPYFEYTEKVTVKVYYEDIASIHAKLRLYKSYRIPSVAFWRIGQGPRELWDTIAIGVQ